VNFRVHAQLIGKDEVSAKLAKLDDVTARRIRATISYYSTQIMNEAKRLAPVNYGRLRASIQPSYYNNGMTADISTNTGYAAFVEFGTGPRGKQRNLFGGPLPPGYQHGSGGKMAPIEVILDWMRRKGIKPRVTRGQNPNQAMRSLAFLIARAIGRRGLHARPFMFPAFEMFRPKYEDKVKRLVEEAAKNL